MLLSEMTPPQKRELIIRLLESGIFEEYERSIVRTGNCDANRWKLYSLAEFKMYLEKSVMKK